MKNEETKGIIINMVPVKFKDGDKTFLKVQYGIPCEMSKDFVGFAVFDSYNDIKVGNQKVSDILVNYIGQLVDIELKKIVQQNNSIKFRIAKVDGIDVL